MEKEAEMRNKLQAIKTVLEQCNEGKKPPANLIRASLQDLQSIEELLSKL